MRRVIAMKKALPNLVLFVPLLLSAAVTEDVKEVRQTAELSADGRVSIDTYKGSIRVSSWGNPQVEIYARIEPEESLFSSGMESVEATEIRIDASSSSVRIKSDYGKVKRGWSGSSLPFVHYEIKMPRTARLIIKDYKSKSEVAGLRSEVGVQTYKGSVVISDLDGSLQLKTYKGNVRVEFSNLHSKSRFETYKGEVEVALPAARGFDLESDLGRRADLESDFDLKAISTKGSRGKTEFRGAVNGGGPKLYLKSYKGTFRLRQT
jgi:hypothetical protein